MRIYGLITIFFLTTTLLQADYKRLTDYDDIFYNLIVDYVSTNSTSSPQDVLAFINSPATATVFRDSLNAGYDKKMLIFASYQSSFGTANPNQTIIDGLHEAYRIESNIREPLWYSTLATTGVSSAMLLYLAGFSWLYFKKDRPALNYYKTNHHRYTTSNPILTINTTTPLVPEPYFPAQ